MPPDDQLSPDEIRDLAIEFAKMATLDRLTEKGSAEIVYGLAGHGRFFFRIFDYFMSDLTTENESRKKRRKLPPEVGG